MFHFNLTIFNGQFFAEKIIRQNSLFLGITLKIIFKENTCTNMFISLHFVYNYVLYIVVKYWAVEFIILFFIGDYV